MHCTVQILNLHQTQFLMGHGYISIYIFRVRIIGKSYWELIYSKVKSTKNASLMTISKKPTWKSAYFYYLETQIQFSIENTKVCALKVVLFNLLFFTWLPNESSVFNLYLNRSTTNSFRILSLVERHRGYNKFKKVSQSLIPSYYNCHHSWEWDWNKNFSNSWLPAFVTISHGTTTIRSFGGS